MGTVESEKLPPLPKYADITARYNKQLIGTDRVVARANIQLTYFDKNGERNVENPEGTLQIVRAPSGESGGGGGEPKLALSLGKAGQTLFWFGTDGWEGGRYWWLDLTDNNNRTASVGKLALFETTGAKQRVGVAIKPTDLVRLLGIVPLPVGASAGQLQWTRDAKLLGVVTRLGPSAGAGYQRLWLDPASLAPTTIELYDSKRKLVLVGEHEGQENVEITRTGFVGSRPRVPGRVYCRHLESATDIRLTLTGVKDGPISDKAFVLDELKRRLGVNREVDLDAAAPRAPAGGRRAEAGAAAR